MTIHSETSLNNHYSQMAISTRIKITHTEIRFLKMSSTNLVPSTSRVPRVVSMLPASTDEIKDRECSMFLNYPFPVYASNFSAVICRLEFGPDESRQCQEPVVYTTSVCQCKIIVGKTCMVKWFNFSTQCAVCQVSLKGPLSLSDPVTVFGDMNSDRTRRVVDRVLSRYRVRLTRPRIHHRRG